MPGISKYTLEDIQKVAEDKGGKLLSKSFVSLSTKMVWQCAEGHVWETTASSVIFGKTWCRKCFLKKIHSQRKKTIDDMREFANSKGWQCLSEKYVSSKSDLKWQCENGHTWLARWDNIKRGSSCPHCQSTKAGNRKK